ncbi:hypothetical protein PIB30_025849 [Stylosanthes scabra]|uniref:Uncharacterized protein n=1 Tax=Stylosanthes scabra TaxID=79078 RepID=A0ABU6W8P2_9FABA|nr:hypothetical protein [Stylosanthes scabra]
MIPSKNKPFPDGHKDNSALPQKMVTTHQETVQDLVHMQLQEIQGNIKSRRNKIFLLKEELRRLRVQQRLKSLRKVVNEEGEEETNEMPEIPSSIPFLPHVETPTYNLLYPEFHS